MLHTDVWLDGWQVEEDHLDLTIGERIERITAEFVQSDAPTDPGLVAVPGSAHARSVPSLRHRPVGARRAVGFVVRIA